MGEFLCLNVAVKVNEDFMGVDVSENLPLRQIEGGIVVCRMLILLKGVITTSHCSGITPYEVAVIVGIFSEFIRLDLWRMNGVCRKLCRFKYLCNKVRSA